MKKNMKNAVSYPAMMIGMLLIVLFVLFTKVMPVFEKVYKQLGAQMRRYRLLQQDWEEYFVPFHW